MMTIDQLVIAISMVCHIGSTNIDRTIKQDCLEQLTNCAVGPSGQISEKKLDACVKAQKKDQKQAEETFDHFFDDIQLETRKGKSK